MGCPWILTESMEDKRKPLGCRRSVSWYGGRQCLLKEPAEANLVSERNIQMKRHPEDKREKNRVKGWAID